MKGFFVFGLIASLCLFGVFANEETPAAEVAPASETPSTTTEIKEKICEPSTLSEVGCNTCICNKDGTDLACTKKICPDFTQDTVVPQNLPVPDVLPAETASETPAETAEVKAEGSRRRRRGY